MNEIKPKKLTKVERGTLATRIAKDVLKQVAAGSLEPLRGNYVETIHFVPGDLQSQLKAAKRPCEVCAMGAMFCAQVLREDDFQLVAGWGISHEDCHHKLKAFFSQQQLSLIEMAFEAEYWDWIGNVSGRAKCYGSLFKTDLLRMQAIMKNIIANGGVFKVPGVRELLAQRAMDTC